MTASHKSAGVISKPGKPEIAKIVPELLAWFRERGYALVVDPETAPYAHGIDVLTREEMGNRPLNFVVVLGGDGTLLSAARAVSKAGIPVLGVNLGSLGFLTEVPLDDLYPTLQEIEKNCCNVETRSMVHCELVRKDSQIAQYDALNDVVVGKGTIARLNHCDVYVDGQVGMPMLDGDRIQCRKSQYQVKLLHTHGTFFDVLRAKLKWGQR